MKNLILLIWLAAALAAPVAGQQAAAPTLDGPWWIRVLYFVVSLPYTFYMVFVDGQRMHLLPAPLMGTAICLWSFREWRRQRYWTPRIVHIMAALALVTIVMINADWVSVGGQMNTQRYVVIAIFGLFPYVAYLLFLGPKYLGTRRAPMREEGILRGEAARPLQSGARGSSGLIWLYAVLGGVAIGLVGVAVAIGPRGVDSNSSRLMGPEFAALSNPESMVPLAHGVERGEPGAQITIVEFGDYQCPACGAFANHHKPRVEESFLTTGRAKFVYFDYPLTSMHANAVLAARAAHCAEDQGLFWEYHDELYRQQPEWSPLLEPEVAFATYAGSIGLNVHDFRVCLDSGRHADLVAANEELALALGIRSTPTILIMVDGGETRRSPAFTFEAVGRTFEEVVASVGR